MNVYHRLANTVADVQMEGITTHAIVPRSSSPGPIAKQVGFGSICSGRYDGLFLLSEAPDPTESRRLAAFWSVVGVVSGLVFLLTISDLPWESIFVAMGCTCKCTSEQSDRKQIQQIATHLSGSPGNNQQPPPAGVTAKGMNYHVRTAIWNPDQPTFGTPVKTQYDGYHSPPIHTNIHSVADAVLAKKNQEASDEKHAHGANTTEPSGTKSVDTMFSWPRQLQDQLRNSTPSATSSNSVRPLISPQ